MVEYVIDKTKNGQTVVTQVLAWHDFGPQNCPPLVVECNAECYFTKLSNKTFITQ